MVWNAAWRANLPWAGVPTALAQINNLVTVDVPALDAAVAAIDGVTLPSIGGQIGKVEEGTWQLVSNTITPTAGPDDVFVVSGDVLVRGAVGIVSTDVVRAAGAIEAQLGTAADPDAVLGTVTDIVGAAGDIWVEAGATLASEVEALDLGASALILADGADIVLTVDQAPDSGAIDFYLWWIPLSAGATVTPAP